MVDGRLLSNRRPRHYQNCLLKMSYLFDGRTRLGYYMLKNLIRTVSRGRGDTRPIAPGGRRRDGGFPGERGTESVQLGENSPTTTCLLTFFRRPSLAKRDSYIQIALAKYFPLSSPRRREGERDPIFHAISRVGNIRRISRNYGFFF